MISFAWPYLLALLPLPLLVYFLPAKKHRQSAALHLPVLLPQVASAQASAPSRPVPLWLAALLWCLLVLSVTRPQWLGEPIDIPSEGREMMIAVDLSGSMQIEDMQLGSQQVDRLTMLKVLLSEFITNRQGDRLGLILFGDDAYMQAPMTFDRATVKQMLEESFIGLVGTKTAIGDAIGLAVKRFDEKKESNRVLILLTDGQNTAGKLTPEQGLELAVAKNITIYTIGIGADVMIERSLFGNRKVNPSADLDERSLANIAEQTGGKYFRARDSQSMKDIYKLLDQLEPIEQDQQQMRPLKALFFYPLALALLLIFVQLLRFSFNISKQVTN
jgi:Ca-activated chloride channel family protein